MVSNRKVLKLLVKMSDDFESVRVADLERRFDLSRAAATDHLRRLWKDRLIETVQSRPREFKFHLRPGESLASLKFRITSRGRDRLVWHDENDTGLEWLFE